MTCFNTVNDKYCCNEKQEESLFAQMLGKFQYRKR